MLCDYFSNRLHFAELVSFNGVMDPYTTFFGISLLQHCAGINCLKVLKATVSDGCDYLFTGSRDGTLKRWALSEDSATCSATFESHVDWVLF